MDVVNRIKRDYRAKVLEHRLKAGIKNQKEFAELTGIAPSILSDLESSRLFLSSPYALRIAEVLDCKVDDLYERKKP